MKLLAVLILFLAVGPSSAQSLLDPTPMAGPAIHGDNLSRANYAARLERAMLQSGISAEVMRDNDKLIVFGFWSKADAYAILTRTTMLKDARAAGFATLDLADRGYNGHWIFDLSGGIPDCDTGQRLCR